MKNYTILDNSYNCKTYVNDITYYTLTVHTQGENLHEIALSKIGEPENFKNCVVDNQGLSDLLHKYIY